ncbi:type II toxin-antitoxin system VapC family toxin [Thiothrix unzii]|jgi:predicted nucleic acid-binding protein|uniref:type II toxin-antitoxin system VapC family toxin n=1 Tax=Thiothrix unzii TaxID=111769 RepID=UPI002A35BCE3|nr:type II toxin-antitoxin system VapC family toxin [Thiothrix unzii]MDX9988437.1 type II toxin-antitoxin system VapC family toxin [Thiothrix unzii]
MGLIIDTNVFIDAENGRLELGAIPVLQTEPVFIAAITVSELLAGVKLAKTPEEYMHRHTYAESILNTIPVLDFDTEVARTYAELYAQALGQQRRSNLNVHDLQIAATALVQGYSILTTNVDDFKGVPGVRLISPYALQGDTIHEEQASYAPSTTI